MRRLGQLLVWLLGMLLLATTTALIVEGASPDVSPLFAWVAAVDPSQLPGWLSPVLTPGRVFKILVLIHMSCAAAMAWLVIGLAMASGARAGLRVARWFVVLTWPLAALAILAPWIDSTLIFGPTGWIVSAGLHSPQVQGVVDALSYPSGRVVQWALLVLFACLAAATLLAGGRQHRWILSGILAVALFCIAMVGLEWRNAPPDLGHIEMLFPLMLGVMAFAAFLESDQDHPGAPHLITGLALTAAASIYVGERHATGLMASESTLLITMAGYSVPYALVTFLGLALLDKRWSPSLPRPLIWLHALGLVALAVPALLPMSLGDRLGVPPRLIDFPPAYADARFGMANAQLLLLVWILGGVAIMHRYRHRRQVLQPHPPARQITDASRQAA